MKLKWQGYGTGLTLPKFLLGLVPLICLSRMASGNTRQFQADITRSQVLSAPEKIKFSDWHEVAELENGTEYSVSFPSPFVSGSPKNDQVPLKIFVPLNPTGPVAMVLIAHYWGATDLKAETALASYLNQKGLAAAILTLPFHMERTPVGAKSGEMAIRPDPLLMKQMMFQSEEDARRSLDFFDQRPEFLHGHYGMVGISLGALVAALSYATDDRIADVTFALGGGDLAHIVWNSSRVVAQKEILRRKGWNEERLREALKPVEPLEYLPRSEKSTSLVIAGKFDTVVPPLSTTELIDRLQKPQILRIGTGHYGGIFVQAKILRTVSDFFTATLNNQPYVVPNHFSALTLRIGGLLTYPQGADIGVGVDVFHLDSDGKTFGSVFVSPRGPRFYFGQSIGAGLSVGAIGSTKGIGAGLMWSIVL